MTYLYGYLLIGAVFFAVVYGRHRLRKGNQPESLVDVLEARNPNRNRLSYRLVNHVLVPVIGITLVIAAWPVAVFFMVKERLDHKGSSDSGPERAFAVERQHLLKRLSVAEVEAREVVVDPLQAVPELPFGHLNAAWQEFLKDTRVDDELWSFAAHWQTRWGRREVREGYVTVREGTPSTYFLTVVKELPEEA